jgi:hypothetical protein
MTKALYRFRGKALSIAQPWASAVAFAGKDIENRTWRSHYRGPLAIHASAKVFKDYLAWRCRVVRGGEKRPIFDWINRGRRQFGLEPEGPDNITSSHIIAIAMFVDVIGKSSSPWFVGEWGWVLKGVVPIEPIPRVGALGLWECKFLYRPLG